MSALIILVALVPKDKVLEDHLGPALLKVPRLLYRTYKAFLGTYLTHDALKLLNSF